MKKRLLTQEDLTEKQIQNAILDYLKTIPLCMVWPVQNGAIFDPTRKTYRSPPKHWRKGVADILGIYDGYPLAIEVKSKKGKISPEQLTFMAEFRSLGGIGFIARSISDVIEVFAALDRGKPTDNVKQ